MYLKGKEERRRVDGEVYHCRMSGEGRLVLRVPTRETGKLGPINGKPDEGIKGYKGGIIVIMYYNV